jgi:hypothetical protein
MIVCGRKPLKTLPKKDIRVKKNNVERTQPNPKRISCFLFRLFSATWVENTPPQNIMVKGLDAVRSSPWIKIFLLVTLENNLKSGNKFTPKAPVMVLVPNHKSTMHPKILIADLILSLLIIAAIPRPDKVMYKPSIRLIAKTRDKPTKKPYVAEVLNTIKHMGPIASCKSIPNLKPL